MKAEVEWIPVADRLPDDVTVLIAVDGEPWTGWYDFHYGWLLISGEPVGTRRVTHWAHMPACPESGA